MALRSLPVLEDDPDGMETPTAVLCKSLHIFLLLMTNKMTGTL